MVYFTFLSLKLAVPSFTFEKQLPRERIRFLYCIYLSTLYVSTYVDVREICIERGRSIALTIPCWLEARSEREKGEKQNGIMVRRLKGETKDEVGGSARELSAIYAPPVIEFP